MNSTKKAFIWISVIALSVFTFCATFVGATVIDASYRNATDLFFMLIWLAAFLIILEYFLLKNFHFGKIIDRMEVFMSAFIAYIYTTGLWYLASWASMAGLQVGLR